jgi:hypothetical protein
MVESPARSRVGELLDQGNAAVMLLVPGKNEEENRRVRDVLQKLTDQVASGEIFPGFQPEPDLTPQYGTDASVTEDGPSGDNKTGDKEAEANEVGREEAETQEETDEAVAKDAEIEDAAAEEAETEEAGTEEPDGLKLAMIEVKRTDPAEAWLTRSLMTVEPDLKDYVDEPMVFAVYGRGRAMPPYIGKGITVDLLTEVVAFLVEPCSCFVKSQNPGMDLLVRWDWEATADRMAANDPSLYPDPMMYQEFAVGEPEETPSSEEELGEADASESAAMGPEDEQSEDTGPEAAVTEQVASLGETETEETETEETGEAHAADLPGKAVVETPEASGPTGESPADPEPGAPVAVESETAPEPVAAAPVPTDAASGSFTRGITWKLAVGLALGAVVVLAAGFVLIRKQG